MSSKVAERRQDVSGTAQATGGLRDVLIETGLQMLAEEGLEKLTLRRVAARAGVSHAAPAYHFKGLPELLGFICAVGFEDLTKSMEQAIDNAADTPRARLVAICNGYVDFALENPGLIQLMFSNRKGVVDDTPLKAASERAYGVLRKTCAPFEQIGAEPDSTETMIWSLVHGFAFLRVGQRFSNPFRATDTPDVADVIPHLALRRG